MITISGLFFGAFAALACAYGNNLLALFLWWFGRFLDGTDGIYARKSSQCTPFGAYLDIVCDMAAYSLMILAFQYRFPNLSLLWGAILVFYVLCITTALSFGILEAQKNITQKDNRGLRLGAGLIEGGETGIAYTLFLFFPEWIDLLASLWLFLLFFTVLSRSLLAKKLFNGL